MEEDSKVNIQSNKTLESFQDHNIISYLSGLSHLSGFIHNSVEVLNLLVQVTRGIYKLDKQPSQGDEVVIELSYKLCYVFIVCKHAHRSIIIYSMVTRKIS